MAENYRKVTNTTGSKMGTPTPSSSTTPCLRTTVRRILILSRRRKLIYNFVESQRWIFRLVYSSGEGGRREDIRWPCSWTLNFRGGHWNEDGVCFKLNVSHWEATNLEVSDFQMKYLQWTLSFDKCSYEYKIASSGYLTVKHRDPEYWFVRPLQEKEIAYTNRWIPF